MPREYLVELRQILVERFNEGELRTLCFDLDIQYDTLPGKGTADKARELVAHCERYQCVAKLVASGKRLRPDISWEKALEKTADPLAPQPPKPDLAHFPSCPYPGMVPFGRKDEQFFFGRKAEVRQMIRRLRNQRFLFVIGPSGSGKSSLISAGLLPSLSKSSLFPRDFWLTRKMRPGDHPLQALAQAIEGDPVQPERALAKLLAAHSPAQRLLLVIDQLEEIFVQTERAEQNRFISTLQTLRNVKSCTLLIVVRADFYADLMDSVFWPIDHNQRLEIAPLYGDALRQAIQRPAEKVGVSLEPRLLERLLADAAGEPGVLPLLQETMVLLWEEMEDRSLSLGAYEQLGSTSPTSSGQPGRSGLAVAVALKADATLFELSPDQQTIARRIFLRLVQLGEGRADTRRRQPVATLRSDVDDPLLFDHTLHHLTENRLLTLSGEEERIGRQVDISHEALIRDWSRLREWIEQDHKALRIHRRLTEASGEWEKNDRDESYLYRGAQLIEAEKWRETHVGDLNESEHVFLQISLAERKQEEQKQEEQRRKEEQLAAEQRTARQLRQLNKQIQEQAQRVQQIVETVPEGVLLLDADKCIVLVNPLGEKELIALAGAKVGDTLTHLGNRPLIELLMSPPKGLWHELTTDGRYFQVIARPLETGPELGGWVLVIHDVTQAREVREQLERQERLAAVGQLAAGIAHDFNNIMAVIVLYSQIAARTEGLPTHVQERMAIIDQQANHATRLIRQILDFSRRAVLEQRPLDLSPFLKEQVKLLARTLPENIEIRLVSGPDEYIVNADLTRLQQAVMNLAINARDAMPDGGELRIGLEQIQVESRRAAMLPGMKAGDWVQVTVSDTGTGIPPEVLPHLFEPFFTTKALGQGTGLGLAQVHGIVGSHDGHIDVKTKVDAGTTFTIYLPALPSHTLDAVSLETESFIQAQGETILVVEDNADTRKALADSLELLNYQVLVAANGYEALALLEQPGEHVSLVLSDLVMPDMGGIALLHALRERELEVPVVILTGHPMEKELEDLQAQGITPLVDWLFKPLNLEQLARVIAKAIKSTENSQ